MKQQIHPLGMHTGTNNNEYSSIDVNRMEDGEMLCKIQAMSSGMKEISYSVMGTKVYSAKVMKGPQVSSMKKTSSTSNSRTERIKSHLQLLH